MPSIRPKKRFGQNFLKDQSVIRAILEAAELDPDDQVVEIGPGLGALTENMVGQTSRLLLLEVDRDIAALWRKRDEDGLQVVEGDALSLDWNEQLHPGPWKMVANLPYNISSQVVFKILEHRDMFTRMVLMFQREVAERLAASPGGKNYGILSVLCQVWFDIRKVVRVAPGAFFPPPKVESMVLCFDRLPSPRVEIADEPFFLKVVKAAFAQRRKTLRNTLTGAGFSREQVGQGLEMASIDPQRRGETLTLEEFARLTDALNSLSVDHG
ncbi:MAG: ribosomal RNA small subunit methyltransferase A [Desulfuromonas sp.]|nr:MAG: ribosomal RNA small subunit methyltransferase A [Desulfuromonas sp.]